MKVWAVCYQDEVVGVYSTEEKAMTAIRAFVGIGLGTIHEFYLDDRTEDL